MSSGLLPVVDALRAELVGLVPAGTFIDDSASRPDVWREKALYVYEDGLEERVAAGLQMEQLFEVMAVYVADVGAEEPKQERRREITEELTAIRDDWFSIVRDERARSDELWSDIRTRADYDLIRGLEVRGFAVRFIGRRFILE